MSFLDRFKRKASEEKTPENAPEGKSESAPETKPDAGSGAPPRKVDPAVQIAAAAVAAGYNPEFKLPPRKEKDAAPASVPAADSGPQHEVILELGDFLGRLPNSMLKDEAHDPKAQLKFDIAELADRISRGQTTISLNEVYRRVPHIFKSEILPSETTEIRFPWQKVMKMLTAYKSASGGPAPAGLSSAAAETLAEKLRSRRGVRNIIPGGPLPESQPSAAAASAPAAAAAQAIPSTASIVPPLAKPPELVLPTSNPEEDEKMTKEDALKARDALRNTLARIKGEFERHLAASEQQRKTLAEEREKMVVDLVRTKREIEDKSEQVEFEKSVATKSTDNLTKVQQERDTFKIELSNLKVEVNKLTQQNDQRIKDLITERDALAQQQANLSKQITEFQKRGKIGTMLAADTGAAANPAAERQIDELQRRINVLESGQKDAAQELGREREAKIKLERQLASADRLQQETAAKVQEVQATLQKESESRKRDGDTTRALKDLQDQLAALQASNLKLQAEADEARQQLAAAQEAASAPADWEARATAQFEEDVENYRSRIKGLLQERSALDAEKKKLAAELAARTEELAQQAGEKESLTQAHAAATASTQGSTDLLRSENEKLQAQITALQSERDELASKAGSLDATVAGAAAAAIALQKLTSEKDATAAELTKVRADAAEALQKLTSEKDTTAAELTKVCADAAEALQKLTSEKDTTAAELAKVRADAASEISTIKANFDDELAKAKGGTAAEVAKNRTELEGELAKAKSAAEAELAKVREELAKATAEHEEKARLLQERHAAEMIATADRLAARETAFQELQAKPTADPAELAQLRTELEAARSASEAARSESGSTIGALQEENRKAAAERDALKAELERLKAAQQANRERLEGELTAALKARESESKTLGELRTATEKFFAEKKVLTDELTALRSSHEASSTSTRAANDKIVAELKLAQEDLIAEKAALGEELADLRASARTEFIAAKTAREKAVAELQAAQEKLSEENRKLSSELAEARASHEATSSTTKASHEKALTTLTADRDALREKMAAATTELEALRKQREELVSGRETLTAENFAARSSLEKSLAEVTKHRDDLVNKIEIMASELSGAKQEHGLAFAALDRDRDSLRAAKEAIASEFASTRVTLEKTIADLHTRHDTLAANKAEVDQHLANALRRGEDLEARLEKTEAGLAEAQAAIKKRDEGFAKLLADHADATAKLTTKHNDVVAALAAEKDAAIAKLTADKSTLIAEVDDRIANLKATHEKAVHNLRDEKSEAVFRLTEEMNETVAQLTADRDKVRDTLAEAERKYLAEIASLLEARDNAHTDTAAVANRLADVSVEAENRQAQLKKELEAVTAERLKLAADLDLARDTHKAQAGVFASEFKAVVKQRDDFITALETERKTLAERTAAFERDRALMSAGEAELKARTEREIARMRRERDSIAQQRDVLRGRIEKLMDDQRQMLNEVASSAAFTTMKHEAATATPPPAPAPAPAPTPAPAPAAVVVEPDEVVEPAAKPQTKAWEPRKKEANVIDITEAEIVAPLQGGEGRLKIPRVRPVVIPPPQVRSL